MHGTEIKTANIFAWTSFYFATSASRSGTCHEISL